MATGLSRTFLPAPALEPGRPRFVITGFMGTGKTAAGGAAARLLRLPFVDLDGVIERRAGMAIPEIFERRGEAAFRQAEREVLDEAARLSGVVIATGGGAVLHQPEFRQLAAGAVVTVLTCDPDQLELRLGDRAVRPLLEGDRRRRMEELLAERAQAYAAAGPALDTTALDLKATASALTDRYRSDSGPRGSVTLRVPGPDRSYPVLLRTGLIDHLGDLIGRVVPAARQAVVVVDGSVVDPWGHLATASLAASGFPSSEPIIVPAGEAAKSSGVLADLWAAFRRLGLGRDDPVVAVGGGATLDVAGFAAATYARGVPLVNVPTTLLAMVDAGLGGKVGIDHAGVKNLAGSFHHPALVVADLNSLTTLPPRQVRAGLAECVKAAAAGSPLALDLLEMLPLDRDGLPAHLDWIAEQAIRVKAAYVREDPFDRSLRHALNLGHTFAHAIEAASGYEVLHGEAVSVGLVAAARLGAWLGVTDPALPARLESILRRLGLPTFTPEGLERDALLAAFAADKKRREGRVSFVLPCPGGVDLLTGLDPERALAALMAEPVMAP